MCKGIIVRGRRQTEKPVFYFFIFKFKQLTQSVKG